MFLEHVAIFQDAQMWNGKREIHSKLSRFRYLATRGGVALAVRRCVTRTSSNRLGVAFLVDIHRTSVNRWELSFAAACVASRKAGYRDTQEKLHRPRESNHIDRVFRFALHLHRRDSTNAVASRRTKLHYCETMSMYIVLDADKKTTWTDVRKNVSQKSNLADLHETIHGTACGMYTMYLKQLSSYGCLSWEASLETLAKLKANQPDGVTVSTTVVFVTDSGGDEDKMKHIAWDARANNLFLLLLALPCSLHLYHCIATRSLTFTDYLCETLYSKMNAPPRRHIAGVIGTMLKTEWVQAFRCGRDRQIREREYRRQRSEGLSRATHQP